MNSDKYILVCLAAMSVIFGLAVLSGITFKISVASHAANQAQCESIGGRYDGNSCWYNGKVIDVDTLIKQSE